MNTLNILLVEDDIETCRKYLQEIDNFQELNAVNTTNSSTQAIQDIKAYSPDALILDLELHNGSGNGIDVLKYLHTSKFQPYVIVVTNNPSSATHNIVRSLGADYIIYKQQQNFCESQVISFLYDLKDIIKSQNKTIHHQQKNTSILSEKSLLDIICTELNLVGINTKYKGYKYLRDAIHISINSSQCNITSQLANTYKQNDITIIRAMQYAIEHTWKNEDIDTLQLHYKGRISSERGCPTVTEFISYYVQCISNRL